MKCVASQKSFTMTPVLCWSGIHLKGPLSSGRGPTFGKAVKLPYRQVFIIFVYQSAVHHRLIEMRTNRIVRFKLDRSVESRAAFHSV